MVQGTGLSFHCWLLNQFCPWTNSNSIYQHYLAENLNVGYIAVNLSGQIWGHELIQASNCSQVCLYGYTSQSWSAESGAWTTHSPHVDPSLSPVTLPPQSTGTGRRSPSVPCAPQAALEGFCHPGGSSCCAGLLTGPTSPLARSPVLARVALIKYPPRVYGVQCPPSPSVPTEMCRMTGSSAPEC